jgi:hypothetical protein
MAELPHKWRFAQILPILLQTPRRGFFDFPEADSAGTLPGQTTQGDRQVSDLTEPYRRQRLAEINAEPGSRAALEAQHGEVWTTEELSRDFEVIGFLAPLVVVRRKSDGKKESLEFQDSRRFYFGLKPHEG